MPLQQKELLKYGGRNVILSTTKSQDSRVLAKLFHYSASLRFRPKFGRITKVGPGRLFLPSLFPIFPSLMSIFYFLFLIFPPLSPLPNAGERGGKEEDNGPQMGLKPTAHITFDFFAKRLETYIKKKYRSILNMNHACYGQGKYIPSVTKHGICYVGLRIVKENIYICMRYHIIYCIVYHKEVQLDDKSFCPRTQKGAVRTIASTKPVQHM